MGTPLRAHRRAYATLHAATARRPAPLQHAPSRCIAPPGSLAASGTQTRARAGVSAAARAPLRPTLRYAPLRPATPRYSPPRTRCTPLFFATPRYAPLRPATACRGPLRTTTSPPRPLPDPVTTRCAHRALPRTLHPVTRLRPDSPRCRDLPTRPAAPSCAPLCPHNGPLRPLRKDPIPPATPRDTPLRPATARRTAVPCCGPPLRPASACYASLCPDISRCPPLAPLRLATPHYAPL